MKAQIDIAKNQYQTLDKIYEIHETIKKKTTPKKYSKSDLIYDHNYSFYKYYPDIEKFDKLSLKSKHLFLANLFDDFDKFTKLKTKRKNREEKNKCV